jgi:hypothetical protein
MAIRDDIGSRGEAICFVLLTQFCGRPRPYFRPHFLGEKFPTLDYMVELVDGDHQSGFFFIQVRATREGYTGKGRLKVKVSKDDLNRMAEYPAPVYVIGIDEVGEAGFLLSAHESSRTTLSSMPTDYPLNCENLKRLWEEVKSYWDHRDMRLEESYFSAR